MRRQRRYGPPPWILWGGGLLLIGVLISLFSAEYKSLGGNTTFAGIQEEASIEDRYPAYTPLKLQRDQFDLTPESIGEVLIPLDMIGFNPWVQARTTVYNMMYEIRVQNLGFPVQFYGDNLEFDGTSFYHVVDGLEGVSGAYMIITSKAPPTISAFFSGVPLRVLPLWNIPVKDSMLYIYRIEEPTGNVISDLTITSNTESTLWALTLVNGREVLEGVFHMQNVLPDSTVSSALTALGQGESTLYLGNKVTVADIPFIVTSYHFTPGQTFVPSNTQEIYVLVSWEGDIAPRIHDSVAVIEGQQILWSTKVGESNLTLGVLYTPASVASPYYIEGATEILGITTK